MVGGSGEGGSLEGALLSSVSCTAPSTELLAVSALGNTCPLGLGFLCNILAFDTRCQAVSMRSPGRTFRAEWVFTVGSP